MVDDVLTALRDFGNAIYEAFVWPGEAALTLIAAVAPESAKILSFGNGAVLVTFILALAVWTMLIVLLVYLARFCRNLFRIVSSAARTIWYRTVLALGSFKTMLVCKFRPHFRRKVSASYHAGPITEFDDLDVAVLRCASARGPDLAISAPDLAAKFTMRPTQIQRSLEKLSKNRMLGSVIGSTDGFENYRLTDAGAAFLSMWQKQNVSA